MAINCRQGVELEHFAVPGTGQSRRRGCEYVEKAVI